MASRLPGSRLFLFFFTVHIVAPAVRGRLQLSKAGYSRPQLPTAIYAHTVPASGPLQPVHGFRAYKDTPAAAFQHGVPSDG